jgi:hypothetical protein
MEDGSSYSRRLSGPPRMVGGTVKVSLESYEGAKTGAAILNSYFHEQYIQNLGLISHQHRAWQSKEEHFCSKIICCFLTRNDRCRQWHLPPKETCCFIFHRWKNEPETPIKGASQKRAFISFTHSLSFPPGTLPGRESVSRSLPEIGAHPAI